MQTIYAVYACREYEGGGPICCFVNEADAQAAAEACNAHMEERPSSSMVLNSVDFDGPEWTAYFKVRNAWNARHPVQPGHDLGCDFYSVEALVLHAAALPAPPEQGDGA